MLELSFQKTDNFSLTKNGEGNTKIQLPSAGIVLNLSPDLSLLLEHEATRFFQETVTHSQYVLKQFNLKMIFVSSHIHTFLRNGLLDKSGFTKKAYDKDGSFSYEVESLLEGLACAFAGNKLMKEIMNALPAVVHGERFLRQWPSIKAMESLPCFEEATYKGKFSDPIRFSSSGTLAGMVKPIIFHNGSLDIALQSGSVKAYITSNDSFKLLNALLSKKEQVDLKTAYKGWAALKSIDDAIKRFFTALDNAGFERDFGMFGDNEIDPPSLHTALLALENELENEPEVEKINTDIDKLFG